jgi:hypothetical protein
LDVLYIICCCVNGDIGDWVGDGNI